MESPHANPQPRILLTEARVRRSWSQQEVANRLGTTHVNVSRWERGLTKPNPYYRRKLCMLFGLTEEELGLFAKVDATPRVEPNSAQTAGTATSSGSPDSAQAGNGATSVPPPSPVTTAADSSAGNASASPSSLIHQSAPTPIAAADVIYDPAIPLEPAIPLVGRADLLAALKRRLRMGGSVALTALNGLPGVGKTALSVTLAHDPELRSHFQDGVLWAGLGPDPNIPGLLSRWGTMLGISASEMAALSSNEAWSKAIRAAIGTRALLLVIDDAWTIEDALIFKVGGPRCSHLVTTRFGAIAVQVAGEGATNIHELTNEQSLELLSLLAPNVVANDEPKAQDLVQAVGGLPLALTLMGNYLRKQSYSGQARRIRSALDKLSNAAERLQVSEPRGPSETHPSLPLEQQQISLQTVIAVTDQQLDPEVRKAFYALAVFPPKPNSFSEEAALTVTGVDFDTIDLLADTGLLESSGEGRYTIHQTIADYVRFNLKDTKPYERLIEYAIGTVEENKKNYGLLDAESSTILAALDAAYTLDKPTELIRLINCYLPNLLRLGLYPVAERYAKHLLEFSTARSNKYGIICSLLFLGQIKQKQGRLAEAEDYLKEGLNLAREIKDKELISALLNDLGWVELKRGEYALSETYLYEGLDIARTIEHRERICSLLKILGSVLANQGNFAQSETYLKEGLALARQLEDIEQLGVLLINIGATTAEQGKYEQAEIYFLEGLKLARQIGHREQICVLLINLGDAASEMEKYLEAEIYFQEALNLAKQIEHREWISALLINLGAMTRKLGEYIKAKEFLKESLVLARQIGSPRVISNALYECGNLYLDLQKIDLAKESYNEMLVIAREGDQELIALANYGLARVHFSQNNVAEARQLGELSANALEAIGHRKAYEVREWLNSLNSITKFEQ